MSELPEKLSIPPVVKDFFAGYFHDYIARNHSTYSKIDRSLSTNRTLIVYHSPSFEKFKEYCKLENSNPNRTIWGFIETAIRFDANKSKSIDDFIGKQGEPNFFDSLDFWKAYFHSIKKEEELRKIEYRLDELNNLVRKRRSKL